MSKELSSTSAAKKFTEVIGSAAQLPLVRIDRTDFLTKNLSKLCTKEQLRAAVELGTLRAGIPVETLDKLANAVINAESIKVTSISAVAGIPGGLAMAATIPADLAQFYGFIIRVAQELAFLYGWDEMFADPSNLDDETESQLIVFIGVMSGVSVANSAIVKLFGETAMQAVAKRVAAKALTKTWYYPIVKKIATLLGQRMVKETFAKGISKTVPLLGGVISGGLTLATFKPMSHRLKRHLSSLAKMSPEELARHEASIDLDSESLTDEDSVEIEVEMIDADNWLCACGSVNAGNYCPDCGFAKPIEAPQYKCDKCGWKPGDNTQPPNFCPECGDLFNAGDIVLV